MSDPVQRILTALREHGHEPRKAGAGWCCKCPAHDDRNPSLSIHAGDDGRALVKCHAGCPVDAVCGSIGLRSADLFTPDPSRRNGHAPRTRPSVTVTTTPRTPARNAGIGDGDAETFPTARDAILQHLPEAAIVNMQAEEEAGRETLDDLMSRFGEDSP